MSVRDFLVARAPYLICGLAVALCSASIAFACGAGRDACVLIVVVVILLMACVIAFDGWRTLSFFRELDGLMEGAKEPRLAMALMDEPRRPDLFSCYDALDRMARAASSEVGRKEDDAEAYRRYVEAWTHEVKTPLAASRLLAKHLDEGVRSQMEGELDRADSFVDQALWYARSNTVSSDYFIRRLDLREVVAGVCRDNARFLIERGVVSQIEVSQGTWVYSDAKWLGFMVSQAVVNAAKRGATHLRFIVRENEAEGASSLSGSGSCGASEDTLGDAAARTTTLEVIDDGCGISPEDLPRVFDAGFTGSHARTKKSSTGMGLFLCARMADCLGLSLSLASEEGVRTRFILSFPHDARLVEYGKEKLSSR